MDAADLAEVELRIARADAAAEAELAEAKEDAAASAVRLGNAHMDANLCDAEYYEIRRAQLAARNKWLVEERAKAAVAKEARSVAAFNAWVLADIAATERRHARESLAAQHAAEFACVKEEQAAKRARNASRMASEMREALNARHVQQRDGDADTGF